MKNKILILAAIAALASSALASAVCNPFTPNTVLTAAALNNAIGSPCVNSGVINATPIGSITPSTGAFTTLSASGPVSGVGFNNYIANYLASPPAIGGTTPAAISATTLSASGAVTVPDATTANQAVALGQVLPLSSMTSSRVTTTVAQAIAAGTLNKVQFNTVGYDDLAEFNTATSQWTVKSAGTYFISAAVSGSPTTATNRIVAVFVNGVLIAYLQQTTSEPGDVTLSGTTQLRLALGDVVAIYYYSGLADTLNTGGQITYATLERVK